MEASLPGSGAERAPDRLASILTRSPLDQATPIEERDRHAADRRGLPYLVFRDGGGIGHLVPLERDRVSVGRDPEMEVVLDWDRGISRRHFTLERSPNGWLIADQSRNGTLVNGEKVPGTQLLHDRDLVQIGETALAFRDPAR